MVYVHVPFKSENGQISKHLQQTSGDPTPNSVFFLKNRNLTLEKSDINSQDLSASPDFFPPSVSISFSVITE